MTWNQVVLVSDVLRVLLTLCHGKKEDRILNLFFLFNVAYLGFLYHVLLPKTVSGTQKFLDTGSLRCECGSFITLCLEMKILWKMWQ